MAAEYAKPLPSPDLDTRPFWEYCRAHELRAQRCNGCGTFRWPPRELCPECHSWDYEWAPLSGTGRVYSFVVPHYVSVPAFQPDAPYVIAHITMDGTDDRVRITSNVIDCPWEVVRLGMPVQVVFEDVARSFHSQSFAHCSVGTCDPTEGNAHSVLRGTDPGEPQRRDARRASQPAAVVR